MWELDHKEGWAPKNWCFWIVVLEKTLENILDSIEIKPIHPKGNQPWICTVRTGAKAEASVLWPLDAKGQLIGKDPDAGKDWGQEEKGAIEDEMVGWHYRLNGHEFEQTPGDGEGQGSLVCCSSWGHKEWDTTYWLNNNWSMCEPLFPINATKKRKKEKFLSYDSKPGPWEHKDVSQHPTLDSISGTHPGLLPGQLARVKWLWWSDCSQRVWSDDLTSLALSI